MKNITQTISLLLPLCYCGVATADELSFISDSNKAQFQPYFSLAVMNNKTFELADIHMQKQDLTTAFGVGLVKTTALDDGWLLSQSIELNYATTQFSGNYYADENFAINGRYQEIAVFGIINVKKVDIFENVAPYVEASIGVINANSRFNSPFEEQNDRQWQLGYKLSTGLAFDIGAGNSISFGVGFTDDIDI